MSKKLSTEEFKERLYNAVGDKYSLKDGEIYQGKTSILTFHCNIHNIDFQKTAECFMRGPNDVRGSCPKCNEDHINSKKDRVKTACAYCGKEIEITKYKFNNSKSGLHFCCREHKDLAQRLESGEQFNNLRPDHYGKLLGKSSYRNLAFRNYPHKCAVCGWDEDEDILQVHHIDEDRNNCNIDNLIILCPTCHWKLTMKKYKLYNNQIIKI